MTPEQKIKIHETLIRFRNELKAMGCTEVALMAGITDPNVEELDWFVAHTGKPAELGLGLMLMSKHIIDSGTDAKETMRV